MRRRKGVRPSGGSGRRRCSRRGTRPSKKRTNRRRSASRLVLSAAGSQKSASRVCSADTRLRCPTLRKLNECVHRRRGGRYQNRGPPLLSERRPCGMVVTASRGGGSRTAKRPCAEVAQPSRKAAGGAAVALGLIRRHVSRSPSGPEWAATEMQIREKVLQLVRSTARPSVTWPHSRAELPRRLRSRHLPQTQFGRPLAARPAREWPSRARCPQKRAGIEAAFLVAGRGRQP